MAAAARAAERESRRRQRDLVRRQAAYAKMQTLERAAYEVEVYENLIERLLSVHKDGSEPVNWTAIAEKQAPAKPVRTNRHEDRARVALAQYRPSILDRLFRRISHRRQLLEAQITAARQGDDTEFQKATLAYQQAYGEWEESSKIATRILARDMTAYTEAIEELDPFSEVGDLGSKILFEVRTPDAVEVVLHVHGDEVIPKSSKNLLKSGKLSIKPLPPTKFHALYQDYVCSAVLRVAKDVLAVLPISMVVVTAVDLLLNSASGHQEELPVLSVAIPRETLQRLNLETIDPSDSLKNFVHRIAFKKAGGFASVERLWLADIRPSGTA